MFCSGIHSNDICICSVFDLVVILPQKKSYLPLILYREDISYIHLRFAIYYITVNWRALWRQVGLSRWSSFILTPVWSSIVFRFDISFIYCLEKGCLECFQCFFFFFVPTLHSAIFWSCHHGYMFLWSILVDIWQ